MAAVEDRAVQQLSGVVQGDAAAVARRLLADAGLQQLLEDSAITGNVHFVGCLTSAIQLRFNVLYFGHFAN